MIHVSVIRCRHLNLHEVQFPSTCSTVVKRNFSPLSFFVYSLTSSHSSETTASLTEHRPSSQRNSRRQSTTIENTFTENEARANYFRNVEKTREIMLQASKRLTKDLLPSSSLPMVDTHCHFDLIFDR